MFQSISREINNAADTQKRGVSICEGAVDGPFDPPLCLWKIKARQIAGRVGHRTLNIAWRDK